MRGWWFPGEAFTYRYEDARRSTQRITDMVPGKRLAWHVEDSYLAFAEDKSEWNDTDVTCDIAPAASGTEVRFTHAGIKPAVECYEQCSGAWRFAVAGNLRDLIASSRASATAGD